MTEDTPRNRANAGLHSEPSLPSLGFERWPARRRTREAKKVAEFRPIRARYMLILSAIGA